MSLLFPIIFISVVLFLFISAIIFYYTQEYILFHPTVLDLDHQYKFELGVPFEEFHFKAEKEAEIFGIHFKPLNPKAVMFYYHGNSKDAQYWGHWCEKIAQKYQLEVVMQDYRGFGKSTGKRSHIIMLSDALSVYRYFEHIDLPHIIYGRSLGGSFASHVALMSNAQKLILESSFTRTSHIVLPFSAGVPRYFLLRFPFQNIDNLKKFSAELIIIHGKKDVLIPVTHAKRMMQMAASNKKQLHLIEQGTHWNLSEKQAYWEALDQHLG